MSSRLFQPHAPANLLPEKLNTVVRSSHVPEPRERIHEAPSTPLPAEPEPPRHEARSVTSHSDHDSRSQMQPNQTRSRERSLKYSVDSRQHTRNGSGATGGNHSSVDYSESQQAHGRRHDYDVQSMETSVTHPRNMPKNPIPAPIVTVRSEFPTLNRSRQQQSLTCLITVEVVDAKWRPDPEDIRSPPPIYPSGSDAFSSPRSSEHRPHVHIPMDPPDVLARISEELRTKVDNWHGLDFAR